MPELKLIYMRRRRKGVKEELKEKIIKESQGVRWRHVSSANRFHGRCAALGPTLR